MTDARGYRGYVGSRAYFGMQVPQRVQNIVIRDYAERQGLHYLLSAVEYAMPGSFMMLDNILDELPSIGGIICYSVFMLPPDNRRRRDVYRRLLDNGGSLHSALEGLVVAGPADVGRVEDIWLVQKQLGSCPVAV